METESLEDRVRTVEARLASAERRHRLVLAGVGAVALVGGLAWVAIGATSRAQAQKPDETVKVIGANEFVLKDSTGEVRAVLGMVDGEPGLTLYDKDGKCRADLSLNEIGAGLDFMEENGKSAVLLGVKKSPKYGEVLPFLALTDHSGTMRALVQVEKEMPSLLLFDRDGKRRAGLGVYEDGPKIRLTDEDGQVTWGAP